MAEELRQETPKAPPTSPPDQTNLNPPFPVGTDKPLIPSLESKPKKPSFFVPLLVILLLAALGLAGFFGYKYWQTINTLESEPSPLETPSPGPSPTTNWKTYTGESITFKYPEGLSIKPGNAEYFGGEVVVIKNQTNSITLTIYPAVNNVYTYGFSGNTNIVKKPITLTFLNKEYETEENIVENRAAYIETVNDQEYSFMLGTGYPAGNDELASLNDYNQSKNDFLQILSTFKIIDHADPTANWQTYTNQEHQYSFKYPSTQTVETNEYNNTYGGKTIAVSTIYSNQRSFTWFMEENTNNVSLNTYIEDWSKQLGTITYTPATSIGNVNGTLAEITGYASELDADPAHLEFYMLGKNNSLHRIRLYTKNMEISDEDIELFYTILESINQ